MWFDVEAWKSNWGAPHLNWSCRLIQGYNLTEKIKTTARDNFPSRHMSRNWGYNESLSFVESSISDFSVVEVLSYLHCRCELWKFVQRFALRQWNGIISCLLFYCRNTQAAKVCITSKRENWKKLNRDGRWAHVFVMHSRFICKEIAVH